MKGILFDLDGTIVDSLSITFDAFNHGIISCGARAHTREEIARYFGTGEPEIMAQILGEDLAEKAYLNYHQYFEKNLLNVPLHRGIGDLIEKIKSKSIPMAIVTGRNWKTTQIILKHHGILDRFVTVVANNHVPNPKPAPDGIRLATSRMGLDPKRTIYIGDTHMDMQAANSAGSKAVAALWDFLADRKQLAQYNPQYFAEAPGHVWEIWEKLTELKDGSLE